MARFEGSRKSGAQHGGNKFGGFEGKNVRIGEPAERKIRGDRLTAGSDLVRRLPVRVAFDIEMLEGARPILHGVTADDAVPMQLIDREAKFFSGAQGAGE